MSRVRFQGAMRPNRALRLRHNNPYSRRPPRKPIDWVDVACWCVVWAATITSAALVLRATINGLASLWQ